MPSPITGYRRNNNTRNNILKKNLRSEELAAKINESRQNDIRLFCVNELDLKRDEKQLSELQKKGGKLLFDSADTNHFLINQLNPDKEFFFGRKGQFDNQPENKAKFEEITTKSFSEHLKEYNRVHTLDETNDMLRTVKYMIDDVNRLDEKNLNEGEKSIISKRIIDNYNSLGDGKRFFKYLYACNHILKDRKKGATFETKEKIRDGLKMAFDVVLGDLHKFELAGSSIERQAAEVVANFVIVRKNIKNLSQAQGIDEESKKNMAIKSIDEAVSRSYEIVNSSAYKDVEWQNEVGDIGVSLLDAFQKGFYVAGNVNKAIIEGAKSDFLRKNPDEKWDKKWDQNYNWQKGVNTEDYNLVSNDMRALKKSIDAVNSVWNAWDNKPDGYSGAMTFIQNGIINGLFVNSLDIIRKIDGTMSDDEPIYSGTSEEEQKAIQKRNKNIDKRNRQITGTVIWTRKLLGAVLEETLLKKPPKKPADLKKLVEEARDNFRKRLSGREDKVKVGQEVLKTISNDIKILSLSSFDKAGQPFISALNEFDKELLRNINNYKQDDSVKFLTKDANIEVKNELRIAIANIRKDYNEALEKDKNIWRQIGRETANTGINIVSGKRPIKSNVEDYLAKLSKEYKCKLGRDLIAKLTDDIINSKLQPTVNSKTKDLLNGVVNNNIAHYNNAFYNYNLDENLDKIIKMNSSVENLLSHYGIKQYIMDNNVTDRQVSIVPEHENRLIDNLFSGAPSPLNNNELTPIEERYLRTRIREEFYKYENELLENKVFLDNKLNNKTLNDCTSINEKIAFLYMHYKKDSNYSEISEDVKNVLLSELKQIKDMNSTGDNIDDRLFTYIANSSSNIKKLHERNDYLLDCFGKLNSVKNLAKSQKKLFHNEKNDLLFNRDSKVFNSLRKAEIDKEINDLVKHRNIHETDTSRKWDEVDKKFKIVSFVFLFLAIVLGLTATLLAAPLAAAVVGTIGACCAIVGGVLLFERASRKGVFAGIGLAQKAYHGIANTQKRNIEREVIDKKYNKINDDNSLFKTQQDEVNKAYLNGQEEKHPNKKSDNYITNEENISNTMNRVKIFDTKTKYLGTINERRIINNNENSNLNIDTKNKDSDNSITNSINISQNNANNNNKSNIDYSELKNLQIDKLNKIQNKNKNNSNTDVRISTYFGKAKMSG